MNPRLHAAARHVELAFWLTVTWLLERVPSAPVDDPPEHSTGAGWTTHGSGSPLGAIPPAVAAPGALQDAQGAERAAGCLLSHAGDCLRHDHHHEGDA